MYTKEQLQAMSDFEVNKALALMLPYTCVVGTGEYPSQSDSAVHVESRKSKYANIEECGADYCNEPNNIMPLAFEYELNIHKTRYGNPEWFCSSRINRYYEDVNPLRAIACCLILVLQERNA